LVWPHRSSNYRAPRVNSNRWKTMPSNEAIWLDSPQLCCNRNIHNQN